MSSSDNQILQVVGAVGGGGVHGNDEEKEKKQVQRWFVCTRNFRRAKQVVLFTLSNTKNKIHQRRKQPQPHQHKTPPSSSSSSVATAKGCCCFCLKQPHTLDSPAESICSDPNDPKFSYDMLKSLIENNDFYSKDCNPHLDFHDQLP